MSESVNENRREPTKFRENARKKKEKMQEKKRKKPTSDKETKENKTEGYTEMRQEKFGKKKKLSNKRKLFSAGTKVCCYQM